MYVSSETTEDSTHSERLRQDYKGAFDDWALQVSRLQAIAGLTPEGCGIQEAEQRAAAAEVAYRDSRDRMTDDMGWNPPAATEPVIK